jgi:two-component system CheB/CheR fusion protein
LAARPITVWLAAAPYGRRVIGIVMSGPPHHRLNTNVGQSNRRRSCRGPGSCRGDDRDDAARRRKTCAGGFHFAGKIDRSPIARRPREIGVLTGPDIVMAKQRNTTPSGRNSPPKAPPRISAFPTASAGPPAPFSIVGIGASAGGFEAFSQLLEGLPPDARLAIIFVQHLAPQHESALTALLGTHSRMPVVEVTDGMRLEANHVYVVPPNVQMDLADGRLHLTPRPRDRSQYTPIDHFFRSLARALKQNAIGVVLSGTASDGADGLREIKVVGGIALAQDPDTARYDGMPRAAIATRMVDLVLPPKEIAAKLAEIAAHPILRAPASVAPQADRTITDTQLDRVFDLLLPAGGVNFAHYKSPTIIRRLLRRMALLRINDTGAYIVHLEQTPTEVINLYNDLLIHVTRFFREPEAFEALARDVLPDMLSTRPDGESMRAWVAGCATGEEAYSLAILLHEQFGDRLGEARIQIFATDVSDASIEFARRGLYPVTVATDVSPERLRKFFSKSDGGYRVTKALRDLCVFARQDLTRDPPFSRLDLICCRNVLIYMDTDLQKKLLSMFHYALKPGGVLLLGHAETIGYNSELFSLMNKKHRIYRKTAGVTAGALDFPSAMSRIKSDTAAKRAAEGRAGSRAAAAEFNRIMLDRYAPPSVLVDENFHVVHFSGQTGSYLEPSPGEPSFHVLKLAREGLLHGLRAAIQAAQKTRRRVRKTGLSVKNGAVWHEVNLEVSPVVQQSQTFYLISFESSAAPARKKPGRVQRSQRTSKHQEHRAARLEEELAATREYLQSTIQEVEAANEELQSANEEILSSNEELQSTNEELDTAKEELQSTNEELNTVNDELQGRNDELTRANADLLNLLSSVQIALVIVSNDLLIRRFTSMAEKTLNLIPSDVGRPFTQISPNIELPELPALITNAIETVAQIEREVQDKQGHWYLLRIRPYKSADNRIDGAVVALFDIDAAKRSNI